MGETLSPARADYLLRVVRIGALCTLAILAPIALYPVTSGLATVPHPGLYWSVVVIAPLAAVGVWLLPWPRLLRGRWPMAVFYVWSVGDIVLISLLVAASDGIVSPLWSVYTLTTIFFAASYPRRPQIVLLLFTIATYVAAVTVATGWPFPQHAGEIVLRMGVLVTVGLMAGFISEELGSRMTAEHRRAEVSRRIADAATELTTVERVFAARSAVDAAFDLGFPVAAVATYEEGRYRILEARGLPASSDRAYDGPPPPRSRSVEVVPVEGLGDGAFAAHLRAAGCEAVLVTPIFVGGAPVGVLVACGTVTLAGREGVQTLGTLVSNALENAELYRLKDDFVANVTHELRTPITVLLGLGETLRRHGERLAPAQATELGERIEGHARRLEAIVTTLLDFADLRARRRLDVTAPIDVAALVRAAVRRYRSVLSPRQVEVRTQGRAVASGDAAMLERVVDNLLANVAAHTPPETSVEVSVRVVDGEVEVRVADDGPGMSEREAARSTERFFRGGDHLTRASSGLGLGLSLVKEILVLHGSGLEVEATPGAGTVCWFRLRQTAEDGGRGRPAVGGTAAS